MPNWVNAIVARAFADSPSSFSNLPPKNHMLQPKGTSLYLKECEALRGIAILLVLLFHCSLQIGKLAPITPTLANSFILAGNTGVTLFFVLSSFLLNLPFMAGKSVQASKFFFKRALRILPMYVLMVVIAAVYDRNILAAIKSLLFFDIQLSTLWPFGSVWWSLAVEVQFYFLLPFLHSLWRHSSRRWLLLIIFVAACFLYFDVTRAKTGNYYFINSARDSILALWPVFLCGAILAAIHARHGEVIKNYCFNSVVLRYGGADFIFCALILFLAGTLLEVAQFGPIKAYLFHFDHVFVEAIGWSCMIAIMLYLPVKTKIVISNPVLIFLGFISYSLYLLHFPVIYFVGRYLNQFPRIIATFSVTEITMFSAVLAIALSTLTYLVIEKPLLELKTKYAVRQQHRAYAATEL